MYKIWIPLKLMLAALSFNVRASETTSSISMFLSFFSLFRLCNRILILYFFLIIFGLIVVHLKMLLTHAWSN